VLCHFATHAHPGNLFHQSAACDHSVHLELPPRPRPERLPEAHGIERAAQSLYYWLGKVGGALRVPRPCHVKQNPAAAAAFRAELEQKLAALNLPKDRAVKIWVADESRFGLHTRLVAGS